MNRLPALLAVILLAACASTPKSSQSSRSPEPPEGESAEPNLSEAARTNTQLGIEYMGQGKLDLAEEKLLRAIEQDPQYPTARAMLGIVYMQQGEAQEARKSFRKALALDRKDPDTLHNYGIFLCAQGETEDAIEHFDEAAGTRNFKSRDKALANAGACLRTSDPARAEGYLRDALKLNPEHPDALREMARLFYGKRDYLRARGFIQRYERVGPVNPEMLWLAARVETALGDPVTAAKYDHRLRTQFPEADFSKLEAQLSGATPRSIP